MKKSVCIIILIITTALTSHAQYVKLALNLIKGNTYYNLTTATASVTQTVNGQKTNVVTTINCRIAFKVMNIRDSLYEMEMRYQSLSLKMQVPQGTVQYSSAGTDAIAKAFAAFCNKPIALVITRSGNLQALAPISPVIDQAVKQLPADQQPQIKSMMEQSFGERAFRSNFEMGTAIFPSVPIKKNAFWISDTQLESSRPANVHSIYELRDITPTFNQIHVNSSITYLNRDEFVLTNGIPLKYNMEGSRSADIVVDTVTGWVKQASILQSIGGTTEIKGNPKMPGGVVIPTIMKSEVVITDVH